MILIDEFLKLEPNALKRKLGEYEVYQYQIVVPAFTFNVIIYFLNESNAVVIKAKNGYKDEVAQNLLKLALEYERTFSELSSLSSIPVASCNDYPFDSFVFLPPNIARCFAHQSDILMNACSWVLTAYHSEFSNGMNLNEFTHQINRKDRLRVDVSDWSRANPVLA